VREKQAAELVNNSVANPVAGFIYREMAPKGKKMGHAGKHVRRKANTAGKN